MKKPKKAATFRLPEHTLEELRHVADLFSCSQADVVETYSSFFVDKDPICGCLTEMFVSRFGFSDCDDVD